MTRRERDLRRLAQPRIAPLDRLRRIARDGADAPRGDVDWLGARIGVWLEDRQRGASLEAVLGVLPMAEGADPTERRVELVKALAERVYPGLPRSQQAKRIAVAALTGDYEQELAELVELAGQSTRARWPLRWRRIHAILQSPGWQLQKPQAHDGPCE